MRKISMFVLAAVVAACGGADSADAGSDTEGTGAVAPVEAPVSPAVVDGTGDGTGASVEALETPADGSVAVEADVAPAAPTTEPAPVVDAPAAE